MDLIYLLAEKDLGDNIALWVLGAITLVLAGAYFFFTHVKRFRGRSKLLEFCFIIIIMITTIIPLIEAENFLSGQFLAALGLFVYLLGRIIALFK